MFAQTGLTHRVALEKVMRLQALVHNACELFCDELRRVQDFDLLLSALQAFKENRLAGVLQKRQGQLSSQQLMEAMSLEIANTTLTQEDKRYLHKRGIRYVGELLYVFFDPRGKGTRELGD
ncbi:MAG: hypothetical protein Q8P45_03685, partial [Candidatus Harrisonbacteria bacterium]|nr:hypothetical protein [Candidatus Harrisonbacteria bacterium]